MAIVYKKIISIKSVAVDTGGASSMRFGLAYGQTYELDTPVADKLITDGAVIDYATALTNSKCPTIIRTEAMRIG
ncbi:hypothetical protein OCF65_00065 [Bacillus toyonensis]|uniref:hypothetical protein n=1 Tax=Bacillus toyonensis TaxID=155322 RepID=UPI0021CE1AB6|nr:hypothetical protein [Bacillus toyonensis]MCU5578881.1 hypothetical protein [Bacillus toyonensis]